MITPGQDPGEGPRGTRFGLCLSIFATQFRIGLLTFGGGVAMIPFFRRECVDRHKWLTEDEFIESVTTALSVPGPLAVTFSIILGRRCAGLAGAVAGVLGIISPSMALVIVAALILEGHANNPRVVSFLKGAGSAVIGLVAFAGCMLGRRIISGPIAALLAASVVVMVMFCSVHPLLAFLGVTIVAFAMDLREADDTTTS